MYFGHAGVSSSPSIPDTVFPGIFDQKSSGMIPTTVTNSQQPINSKPENAPELDVQLGNLSSTISKLKKDAKRFQAQVNFSKQTKFPSMCTKHICHTTKYWHAWLKLQSQDRKTLSPQSYAIDFMYNLDHDKIRSPPPLINSHS